MPHLTSHPELGTRRARLFRNGRNQAIRIPKEFQFDAEEVLLRRDGRQLIIEPVDRPKGLLETLRTLKTLDVIFPNVDDGMLPADDVDI